MNNNSSFSHEGLSSQYGELHDSRIDQATGEAFNNGEPENKSSLPIEPVSADTVLWVDVPNTNPYYYPSEKVPGVDAPITHTDRNYYP